jgi:hypothetical protein
MAQQGSQGPVLRRQFGGKAGLAIDVGDEGQDRGLPARRYEDLLVEGIRQEIAVGRGPETGPRRPGARCRRRRASSRSAPVAMTLATIWVIKGTHTVANAGVNAHPSPTAGTQTEDAPGFRQEAGLRALGIKTNLDRMAAEPHIVLHKPRRQACRHGNLHGHKIKTVMHSVTGCSTCRRVFISRKKRRRFRPAGIPPCRRRHSQPRRAAATAAAPMALAQRRAS